MDTLTMASCQPCPLKAPANLYIQDIVSFNFKIWLILSCYDYYNDSIIEKYMADQSDLISKQLKFYLIVDGYLIITFVLLGSFLIF